MKLIIDIPEEKYKTIQEGMYCGMLDADLYRDIKNGTPLDDLKAEIADTLYVDSLIFGELIDFLNRKISADDVIEEFNRVTKIEVLKIIDKYRAESE